MHEVQVSIDADQLKLYAQAARKAGTQDKFMDLALDWADKAQEYVQTIQAENLALDNRLCDARAIIEAADARAAAVDGPVNHCRDEMTDAEWRKLYLAVKGPDDATKTD